MVKLLHRSYDIIPLPNLSPYLLPTLTHFRSFSLSFSNFLLDFFLLSHSSLLSFALNLLLFLFPSSIRFLFSTPSYSLVHTLLRSHILSSPPSSSPLLLVYFIAFFLCCHLSFVLFISLSLSPLFSLSISRRFLTLPFLFFSYLTPSLSNFISRNFSLSLSLSYCFPASLPFACYVFLFLSRSRFPAFILS